MTAAENGQQERAAAEQSAVAAAVGGGQRHHALADAKWQRRAKRMLRLIGPQMAVVLLLVLYLLGGAICFRLLDDQLARLPFTELVLFCFQTLATIGYGNILPSSTAARLFTLPYSLLGIPLCMLTLANLGKHITKANAMLAQLLRQKRLSRPIGPARLPLPVLLLLFLLCLFCSALLFSSQPLLHSEHLYFSLISFSTVGFGDLYISTEGSIALLLASLLHLSLGVIVLAIWFQIARGWIQRLFHLQRHRFRHARDVQVWFGQKQIRLSNVLEVVAREFQASPAQIRQVIDDLDFIITDALDQAK